MFKAVAKIINRLGDAPDKVLLFAEGANELEGEGTFIVDSQSFNDVRADIARRGIDVVWDYEHQTLMDVKAPAAGWIRGAEALSYVPGVGIYAAVDWTDEAAGYIARGEYRYFSPVFAVRKKDGRLAALHNVALTNSPKTNHLKPILAKLGSPTNNQTKESTMNFFTKLLAGLGLAAGATEEQTLAAVNTIAAKAALLGTIIAKLGLKDDPDNLPDETDVTRAIAKLGDGGSSTVPAEIITALDLSADEADVSTVVASIHAARQTGAKGSVSQAEFDKLTARLAARDADEAVAEAVAKGKITPDQKAWAQDYAIKDLAGFKTYVSKATQVVPLGKLPGHETKTDAGLGDVDMTIAAKLGVTAEDIKTHGGLTAAG